ncbi:MAG: helix-turn-helix domain-containing protein [Methyloligellaceae bacterium]
MPLSAALARRVVEQAVATTFQVPLRELRARTRRKAPVAFARQVAMYLAHVAYGLTLTEVGTLFGRDRTTVAYACRVVEDRRDDCVFDVFLDHLETAIVRLTSALNVLES